MKKIPTRKLVEGKVTDPILVVVPPREFDKTEAIGSLERFFKYKGRWKATVVFVDGHGHCASGSFLVGELRVIESAADLPYTPPPILKYLTPDGRPGVRHGAENAAAAKLLGEWATTQQEILTDHALGRK